MANFDLGDVAWPSCRALERHFQLLSAVSKMEARSGLESTKHVEGETPSSEDESQKNRERE